VTCSVTHRFIIITALHHHIWQILQ